ncbi:MAG: lysophospholipid acyltransferase family protein [Sneathiella sp.]
MTRIRSIIAIILVFIWAGLLIPIHLISRLVLPKTHYLMPQIFHRGLCKLLRVKVVCHGEPSEIRPTLFVINHISWLDIPVIGKALQGSFVAKDEVETYPVIGLFAKLQETIFIAQTRPSIKTHQDDLQTHLENGDNMFLFPEGTPSNGLVTHDFKSTYFSLAETHSGDKALCVQPVTLAYSQMDNMYVTRNIMKTIAWVGNESLLSHMWEFLKSGSVTAELRFHAPVTIDAYDSRKEMAADCQLVIAEGLSRAMTNRPEPNAAK